MSEFPNKPTTRIVGIVDFFGAGNIGDDLMVAGLAAVLEEVQARGGPPQQLTLLTRHRIASQLRRFPGITWYQPGNGYDAAVAEADMLVVPGGTPFMPFQWMWRPILNGLAGAASRPVLALGVGAEVAADRQLPEARMFLRQAALVATRDVSTSEVLRTLAPECAGRIATGADLANIALRRMFRGPGLPLGEREMPLAVLWFSSETTRADRAAVADFVAHLAPADWPAFLSNEYRLQQEFRHFRRLFPRGRARPRFIRPRYYADDLTALVAPYHKIGTLLASRYHALLTAAWAGSRIAALPRSLKVAGLARDLGIPMLSSPMTETALEQAVIEARPVPRALLDALAERALNVAVEAVLRFQPAQPGNRPRPPAPAPESAGNRLPTIRREGVGDATGDRPATRLAPPIRQNGNPARTNNSRAPTAGPETERMRADVPRFWTDFVARRGPDWKEREATSRLALMLNLLDEIATDLARDRVLIVNDGPVQTLARLDAAIRVAIDPDTDVLIEAELLQLAPGDTTRYVAAAITQNTLPEKCFDIVMVNSRCRTWEEARDILVACLRVAAAGAAIAVNLFGLTGDKRSPEVGALLNTQPNNVRFSYARSVLRGRIGPIV